MNAASSFSQQQYTEAMADIVGAAYRLPRSANESADAWAKRSLKKRMPDHPDVKNGTWVLAALRTFYDDLSTRCATLARFERNRDERVYLERLSQDAKKLAADFGKDVQMAVEGVAGYTAPLAAVPDCEPPTTYGDEAIVRKGVVVIENIDRVTFVNDQPKSDAPRTGRGALREIFAAFSTYNKSASMLGMYEKQWRLNKGHVRLTLPGGVPAIYLNEIALGAIEADMQMLHLYALKDGKELCELRLPLKAIKATKKKSPASKKKSEPDATPVKCKSDATLQRCAEHLSAAIKAGPIVFTLD